MSTVLAARGALVKITAFQSTAFALLCLLLSRVYFPLPNAFLKPNMEYPGQWYFMNHLPWATPESVVFQTVLSLFGLFIFIRIFHKLLSNPPQTESSAI